MSSWKLSLHCTFNYVLNKRYVKAKLLWLELIIFSIFKKTKLVYCNTTVYSIKYGRTLVFIQILKIRHSAVSDSHLWIYWKQDIIVDSENYIEIQNSLDKTVSWHRRINHFFARLNDFANLVNEQIYFYFYLFFTLSGTALSHIVVK